MKKSMRLTYLSLFFSLLAILFAGCVKKDDYYKKDTTESARKTVVQIIGAGGLVQYARDVKPTNDTFILIDVRRYPNTEADLNQPLTVKLVANATLIDVYNNANGTTFVELPSNAYTLLTDINNVTFAPGQAVAEIKISVDQSKLDLSESYALAFSLSDAGTNAVINGSLKDALYSIGVKNKYDGYYTLDITTTGWSAYGIADGVTYTWPLDVAIITSGAASVIQDQGFGTLQPAFTSAGDATQFGATAPEFVFDPATDGLIDVHNTIPDDGRGRKLRLNPALNSFFDPATHNIEAHYIMSQNGRPDQYIDEILSYKGPR